MTGYNDNHSYAYANTTEKMRREGLLVASFVAFLAVSVPVPAETHTKGSTPLVCKPGFLPTVINSSETGVECRCGGYKGINCFTWQGVLDDEDHEECRDLGTLCAFVDEILRGGKAAIEEEVLNGFVTMSLPPFHSIFKSDIGTEKNLRERSLIHCRENLTVSAFDKVTCVECSEPNPFGAFMVFWTLTFVPIGLIFIVIAFFNINLAAGPGHSFIFFYQVIPVLTGILASAAGLPLLQYNGTFGRIIWGTLTLSNPFQEMIPVEGFPCFSSEHPPLFVRSLGYLRILTVLILIVSLIVIMKCTCCPTVRCLRKWGQVRQRVRKLREKYAFKGTVLTGVCSGLVLAYSYTIDVSFRLLGSARISFFLVHNGTYTTDERSSIQVADGDRSILYLSNDHLPYFITSIVCVVLAQTLPVLLMYYPTVPYLLSRLFKQNALSCHKLAPVFDVFQSVYKPKLRFFAGLYLFYRLALWSAATFADGETGRLFSLQCLLLLMLSIHCLVQPFQDRSHNYIETLSLLNLNSVCAFVQVTDVVGKTSSASDRPLFSFFKHTAIAFIFFPLIAAVGYFIYLCVRQCRARRRRTEQMSANSLSLTESLTVKDNISMAVLDLNVHAKDYELLRSEDFSTNRVADFSNDSCSQYGN